MKNLIKVALLGVAMLSTASTQASINIALKTVCAKSETVFQSINPKDGGRFIYWEDSAGSSSSDAVFEFWKDGRRLWDAKAGRYCSQGVSTCLLLVPFTVDGKQYANIESEMNYVQLPSGQVLYVFSDLELKITNLYFKSLANREVALVGSSYHGTSYPREDEMVLPTSYFEVDCDDF